MWCGPAGGSRSLGVVTWGRYSSLALSCVRPLPLGYHGVSFSSQPQLFQHDELKPLKWWAEKKKLSSLQPLPSGICHSDRICWVERWLAEMAWLSCLTWRIPKTSSTHQIPESKGYWGESTGVSTIGRGARGPLFSELFPCSTSLLVWL